MKRLWLFLLAGLLIGAIAAPALAWEFKMDGQYEYRFRWFSRTGSNDLFGNANAQTGSWNIVFPVATGGTAAIPVVNSVGLAGPNTYGRGAVMITGAGTPLNGQPANETGVGDTATGAVSGVPGNAGWSITRGGYARWASDALQSDSRWTMRPYVKVNKCIDVHGVYNIGGYRHKYAQRATYNTYDTTLAGVLATGNRTVAPTAGVPPFENYYKSQTSMNALDTAAIGSWEQFRATITIPWGIWSIGVKNFPFGTGISFGENVRAESMLTVVPYGPFRLLFAIWLSRGVDSWGQVPDSDTKRDFFESVLFTYRNGPIEIFGGPVVSYWHSDVQGGLGLQGDLVFTLWDVGFKYNNGRFFANGEYAWYDSDITRIGAAPIYSEAYHCMVETGAVMGPMKLTLAWFQASGPVLNDGNPTKTYAPWAINWQAMEPYDWLMFDIYGGGNQTFNGVFINDGHGMLSDGYVFAGRIDYAAASNLNCWVAYTWAHRLEEYSSLFGAYNSLGLLAPSYATNANVAAFAADAGRAPTGFASAPYGYVTDGFIGWEVDAGVNWKLLEGMTAMFKYAYWAPGDWFREAYQAVGLRGGVPVADTVLPTRDAIQAFQGSLLIEF